MASLGMQREHTTLKSVGYPSLFQPDSEDELSSESEGEHEQQRAQPKQLPIHEVITDTPKTLAALLESLLPRLQPSADIRGVSMQDQKQLTNVLVGELASQFSVIQHQIDDPFLNPHENKDLHRRVIVRVCEILEDLYREFLTKAAGISSGGVFSLSANMSRVRAELILEANKRLNIPLIRRQVLTQIRGTLPSIAGGSPSGQVTKRIKKRRLPPVPRQEVKKKPVRKLSLNDLNLDEPLEVKRTNFGVRLESGAVHKRISKLQSKVPYLVHKEEPEDILSNYEEGITLQNTSRSIDKQPQRSQPKLHRVSSLPELWGAFLLCDLGLTSRPDRPTNKRGEEDLLGIHRPPSVENFMDFRFGESQASSETESKQLGQYTAEDLSKDLQDLCQLSSGNKHENGVEELHPLLQAHGHGLSEKGCQRLAQLDAEARQAQENVSNSQVDRSLSESRIPSVPTLQQLTYVSFDHTDSHGSSHHSLAIESGPSLKPSSAPPPESQSQLLSDFEGTGSFGGTSLDQSGLGLANTMTMLPDQSPGASVGQPGESHIGSMSQPEASHTSSMLSGLLMEAVEDRTGDPSAERLEVVEPDESIALGPVPQSAVITTRMGGAVIRTADIQVSERTPLNELRLKPFGPIYNQITGELNSSMIAELDSSLHEGQEIREVYQEIMKTLPTPHLQFTQEPTLQPAIDTEVDLSHILASDTLHHRHSRRVINKELYRATTHPWGSELSRTEWEKSNQYQGPDLEQYGIKPGFSGPLPPRLSHISRAYNTWANWWNSIANTEDYLKYASREESDYLRLVYHLYDSEGSDSEAEEEVRLKRERLVQLQQKLRAQESRRRQRYSAKSRYQSGVWNVNTVMMGGLGKDPDCSSDEDMIEESSIDHKQLLSPEEAQKRLAELWQRLQFTQSLQMDMAIKYSNPRKSAQLNKVLGLWEEVCTLIEQREALLIELESFEREASDPARFFSRGTKGLSATRLAEAKKRDGLHKRLDSLDKQVSSIVQKLHTRYGDTVTFKGRLYQEKMSADRTEMLYWLQQERRAAVLQPATVTLDLPHPVATITSV